MEFLKDNWPWVQWLLYFGGGLGLFGLYFANIRALLAVGALAGLLVMAGVMFNRGVEAEHARVLAATKAAHEQALAAMRRQKETDDAELARLKELVEQTPPGDAVALKADRAVRIGRVR